MITIAPEFFRTADDTNSKLQLFRKISSSTSKNNTFEGQSKADDRASSGMGQNPLSIGLAVTVQQRRSELNMSREELADAMGVPLELILDIEESNPNECLSSKSTLMILALALRLSEHALAGYADRHTGDEPTAKVVTRPESKPLILPPMFSRKTSLEKQPPIISNDDQQRLQQVGLEAIPSDKPHRPSRPKPSSPKADTPKSPFIPRHTLEPIKPINLSMDKTRLSQTTIEALLKPAAKAESPPITRKSYVPSLASRLPFTDTQRETGIFRIDNAPAPAPDQKVDAQFATSVSGLSARAKDSQ
ncbi:MAG: helix-turn-helix transcriptional regulator [Cyanobacteria bacterium SZAS-4]|nr:helix-turn-helix transcriptional regulator [Cyanobacteria bacterium SZAS-4]